MRAWDRGPDNRNNPNFNHLRRSGYLLLVFFLSSRVKLSYTEDYSIPSSTLHIWKFAVEICCVNLHWLFAVVICREKLPQDFAVRITPQKFAVAICCENLPQEFAVEICHGYLPRVFRIFKQIVFCLCEQILFIWKLVFFICEQNFFICEIFLLTVFLFVIAVAVMGHRI